MKDEPVSKTAATKPATGRTIFFLIVALLLIVALFALVPVEAAPWVTAAHVFAIVAWMAAMLYLPRLFVYHAECGAGSPQAETFKVMERRLARGIMTPSMIATWIFGLWLAWNVFQFQGAWLHAKIALVVVMTGLHGFYTASMKRFGRDEIGKSAGFWRMMNEVPAVLLALILILVFVKPF